MENYEDVRQAIADKNFEEARDLLRSYIKEDPESAEVWYLAAQAAVNEAQRIAFLEKAVDIDPLHALAANELYDLQHPETVVILQEPLVTEDEIPEAAVPVPQYAELGQRFGGFMIDQILLMTALVPVVYFVMLASVGEQMSITQDIAMRAWSIILAISVVAQAAYYGYFLTQREGQTIGKKMMNVRVIKRDGSPLDLWDAILRSVIAYPIAILVFGIGFLWAAYNPQSQGWHDMIADTIVVKA